VTWDDSYCRRITDSGPSGCFIERDLFTWGNGIIPDMDFLEYNCSGKGLEDFYTPNIDKNVVLNKRFYFHYKTSLSKEPFGDCYVFEWKECERSPLDIIDISTCPVSEEKFEIESNPLRIELDDSLIESFNELSDDELELAFGKFTPVQSLNAYITKLSLCSITQVELSHKRQCNLIMFIIFHK